MRKSKRKCDNNLPIICGIYKITSPSGRNYIGQAQDVYDRRQSYLTLNCKSQPRIYRSLNKYGWENHTFEIIEECEFEMLNKHERYYQEFYDAVENGLNCHYTKTDEKPRKLSQETKDKIGNANRGKKRSEEQINKFITANKGKKRTEEFCKRLSKLLTGKIHSTEHRENNRLSQIQTSKKPRVVVVQFDLDGNFIKEWASLQNVSNELNISLRFTNEKSMLLHNFIWIIKDENYKNLILEEVISNLIKHKERHYIIQLDKDNTFIAEWKFLQLINISLNLNSRFISKICKDDDKDKIQFGYKWMFKKNYLKYLEHEKC